MSNAHQYQQDERNPTNRFAPGPRATSQPPQPYASSPSPHPPSHPTLGNGGGNGGRWGNLLSPDLGPGSRSSSFSYGAASRRAFSPGRGGFESTFEEDEYDYPDYDTGGVEWGVSSLNEEQLLRGRHLLQPSPGAGAGGLGSRSQSLLPPSSSNPLSIPRRTSLSQAQGQAPISPSNQSPFVRDVGQILLDDGSAFRELLTSTSPSQPRRPVYGGLGGLGATGSRVGSFNAATGATGSGGRYFDGLGGIVSSSGPPPGLGSGTTSRRHSVSIVQPSHQPLSPPASLSRTTSQGYSRSPLSPPGSLSRSHSSQPYHNLYQGERGNGAAPGGGPHNRVQGFDAAESTPTPSTPQLGAYSVPNASSTSTYPRSGAGVLSDDDLASDLGSLSLSTSGGGGGYGGQPISPRSPSHHPAYGSLKLTTTSLVNHGNGYTPATPHYYDQGGYDSPVSPTTGRYLGQRPPYAGGPPGGGAGRGQAPPGRGGYAGGGAGTGEMSEGSMGKGIPLHSLPANYKLYIVEFKAGRTDLFYVLPSWGEDPHNTSVDQSRRPHLEDLLIVEGDRGKDLGRVVNDTVERWEVEEWAATNQGQGDHGHGETSSPTSAHPGGSGGGRKDPITAKRIFSLASIQDVRSLESKRGDEEKALQLCQQKVKSKKMPMEVVDAEYQWDRKKLTFYFVSDKRIDFRELVRELFRLYKTRIWMAALAPPAIPPNLSVGHEHHGHDHGHGDGGGFGGPQGHAQGGW